MLVHLCEVQDLEPCKGHMHTMLVCVVGSYNIVCCSRRMVHMTWPVTCQMFPLILLMTG